MTYLSDHLPDAFCKNKKSPAAASAFLSESESECRMLKFKKKRKHGTPGDTLLTYLPKERALRSSSCLSRELRRWPCWRVRPAGRWCKCHATPCVAFLLAIASSALRALARNRLKPQAQHHLLDERSVACVPLAPHARLISRMTKRCENSVSVTLEVFSLCGLWQYIIVFLTPGGWSVCTASPLVAHLRCTTESLAFVRSVSSACEPASRAQPPEPAARAQATAAQARSHAVGGA